MEISKNKYLMKAIFILYTVFSFLQQDAYTTTVQQAINDSIDGDLCYRPLFVTAPNIIALGNNLAQIPLRGSQPRPVIQSASPTFIERSLTSLGVRKSNLRPTPEVPSEDTSHLQQVELTSLGRPLKSDPGQVLRAHNYDSNDGSYQIFVSAAKGSEHNQLTGRMVDRFHFSMIADLSPGVQFSQKHAFGRRIMVDLYRLGCRPLVTNVPTTNNSALVYMDGGINPIDHIAASPLGTINSITYKNALKASVNVTGGYTAIPSVSATAGVEMTHEREQVIHDMHIMNNSNYNRSFKEEWLFDVRNLHYSLEKAADVAHSAYRQEAQWIWDIDRELAIASGLYYSLNNTDFYFTINPYLEVEFTSVRKRLPYFPISFGTHKCATSDVRRVINQPITIKVS